MSIVINKPGLLSTIQDLGRKGYGKYGISITGAMDTFAHQIANRLVGNSEQEATIEITLAGWAGEFQSDHWIAITGGSLDPRIDGTEVPMWRPIWVRKGSQLVFKRQLEGCRAYIAVSGGLDIEPIMNSKSTYLRAGIGGVEGRALAKNDILKVKSGHLQSLSSLSFPIQSLDSFYNVPWSIAHSILPKYDQHPVIRIMEGRQWQDFDHTSQQQLLKAEYQMTTQSDRMGYRLQGAKLQLEKPHEYISEAVTNGTIQVPADGQPIILMADRQTLGGYPKIGHVITVDLPVLAQLSPHARIRFEMVTLAQAQSLYIDDLRKMQILYQMINQALIPLLK